MKRLISIVSTVAGMAVLLGATASAAKLYPVAPPGTFVSLRPAEFIKSVPLQAIAGWPGQYPVAGDNIGQHLGWLWYPDSGLMGGFFIGVFGSRIDTDDPDAAVYLWETTGGQNDEAFTGPLIQLGYWDGMAFTPFGNPQLASYLGTGVLEYPGDANYHPFREITSSITPLKDFGITPGFPFMLNAVRIEAAGGHDQVSAVAINLVPETCSVLLLGTGIVGLLSYGRQRSRHLRKHHSEAPFADYRV